MIRYLFLFYQELKARLILLFLVMLVAAIMEGFGISMVLPLIQIEGPPREDALSTSISLFFQVIGLEPTLFNTLTLLVIFFFFRGFLLTAQSWYIAKVVSDHLVEMRSTIVSGLFRAKYQYLISKASGFLTNAITGEVERVNFSLKQLTSLMVFVTTSAVYLVLPLLFEPLLTVFLIALAIPVVGIMAVVNRLTRESSIAHTQHSGRQQMFLIEALRHAKYLKSTGRAQIIITRVLDETRRLGALYRRLLFLGGVATHGFEPLVVLALAGVVFYYSGILGQPVVEILFLLFLFRNAAVNLLGIQPAYRKFLAAAGSLELYQNLRKELKANAEPQYGRVKPDLGHDIALRDVYFRYGDGLPYALKGINLRIPSRKTVAIVGPSGSGKSTLANLLTGILRPTEGELYLNGTPYADLDLDGLRAQTGYVTQEAVVFNAGIPENITLWQEEPDHQRLDQVIKNTRLDSLLSGRQNGNADPLGDEGISMSGGERQRLAIARELYRDFALLILDEATSSMDSSLERQIDDILHQEQGRRTMVVIAHRLATIKRADVIYVLERGEVVAQGCFDDLCEHSPAFRRMVELQRV